MLHRQSKSYEKDIKRSCLRWRFQNNTTLNFQWKRIDNTPNRTTIAIYYDSSASWKSLKSFQKLNWQSESTSIQIYVIRTKQLLKAFRGFTSSQTPQNIRSNFNENYFCLLCICLVNDESPNQNFLILNTGFKFELNERPKNLQLRRCWWIRTNLIKPQHNILNQTTLIEQFKNRTYWKTKVRLIHLY